MLSDVPGVQGGALLGLHGGALVEMLGEVGLVEAGDVDHLPLGDVVLLHVALDHFGSPPRVLAGQRSTWLGYWWEMSGRNILFLGLDLNSVSNSDFHLFLLQPKLCTGEAEIEPK